MRHNKNVWQVRPCRHTHLCDAWVHFCGLAWRRPPKEAPTGAGGLGNRVSSAAPSQGWDADWPQLYDGWNTAGAVNGRPGSCPLAAPRVRCFLVGEAPPPHSPPATPGSSTAVVTEGKGATADLFIFRPPTPASVGVTKTELTLPPPWAAAFRAHPFLFPVPAPFRKRLFLCEHGRLK